MCFHATVVWGMWEALSSRYTCASYNTVEQSSTVIPHTQSQGTLRRHTTTLTTSGTLSTAYPPLGGVATERKSSDNWSLGTSCSWIPKHQQGWTSVRTCITSYDLTASDLDPEGLTCPHYTASFTVAHPTRTLSTLRTRSHTAFDSLLAVSLWIKHCAVIPVFGSIVFFTLGRGVLNHGVYWCITRQVSVLEFTLFHFRFGVLLFLL